MNPPSLQDLARLRAEFATLSDVVAARFNALLAAPRAQQGDATGRLAAAAREMRQMHAALGTFLARPLADPAQEMAILANLLTVQRRTLAALDAFERQGPARAAPVAMQAPQTGAAAAPPPPRQPALPPPAAAPKAPETPPQARVAHAHPTRARSPEQPYDDYRAQLANLLGALEQRQALAQPVAPGPASAEQPAMAQAPTPPPRQPAAGMATPQPPASWPATPPGQRPASPPPASPPPASPPHAPVTLRPPHVTPAALVAPQQRTPRPPAPLPPAQLANEARPPAPTAAVPAPAAPQLQAPLPAIQWSAEAGGGARTRPVRSPQPRLQATAPPVAPADEHDADSAPTAPRTGAWLPRLRASRAAAWGAAAVLLLVLGGAALYAAGPRLGRIAALVMGTPATPRAMTGAPGTAGKRDAAIQPKGAIPAPAASAQGAAERPAPQPRSGTLGAGDLVTANAGALSVVPPSEARADGRFVPILATFQDYSAARQAYVALKQSFPDILSGTTPDIESVEVTGNGTWHRLGLRPALPRAEAEELCRQMQSAGHQGCWVKPQG